MIKVEDVIDSKKILSIWISRGKAAQKDKFVKECELIKNTLESLSPGVK